MEYKEKLEVCYKAMALNYNISSEIAKKIVLDLEIQELVIDYYQEDIENATTQQENKWENEFEQNPDVFGGV